LDKAKAQFHIREAEDPYNLLNKNFKKRDRGEETEEKTYNILDIIPTKFHYFLTVCHSPI
jgi:hypothetical protein